MLILDIGADEAYDEAKEEFVVVHGTFVEVEHSLVSLSKWESFYEKPFLSEEGNISTEETISYIKFMTLSPNVPPELYDKIGQKEINQVNDYIKAAMTATTVGNTPGQSAQSREKITAELIYYWMIALNIPFDPCQNWHLNRLLTLVKVCNAKNQPQKTKKTFTRSDLAARRSLNAQRRAQSGTNG